MCMVIGLLSHVLEKCKDTEPSVDVLLFFRYQKLSYKEDNSPKEYDRRKEHFKLDVWIYLRETSECQWERKRTRTSLFLNMYSFAYCLVFDLEKNDLQHIYYIASFIG